MTYVRVLPDRPVVELLCWPVVDIHDLDAARKEVNILNRDNPLVNVVLDEDRVLVRASVLAMPFVPSHLEDLLEGFQRADGPHHPRSGPTGERQGLAPAAL